MRDKPGMRDNPAGRWKAARVFALHSAAGCLCASLLVACSRGAPPSAAAPAGVKPGTYRAVLQIPAGDLPFEFDLSREDSAWVGYLVNGPERVKLTEVTVAGGHLDIKMPGYENRLTADAEGDRLRGEVVLNKLGGKDQHIPLHAQLDQPYRFFPQSAGEVLSTIRRCRPGTEGPASRARGLALIPCGSRWDLHDCWRAGCRVQGSLREGVVASEPCHSGPPQRCSRTHAQRRCPFSAFAGRGIGTRLL